MVRFELLSNKTRYPQADYAFDDTDKFLAILARLTPKIEGSWNILLIDPSVSFLRVYMQDKNIIPSYIECTLYLPSDKLEAANEMNPDIKVHAIKTWDAYLELVKELEHPMETKAYQYLYKSIGASFDELSDALAQLDKECEEDTITLKAVQLNYRVYKRVYASQLIYAFYSGEKSRWKLYQIFEKELGTKAAFYVLRKQVVKLLKDKDLYLRNEEVRHSMVHLIDAPFLCYLYVMFSNSSSHYQLPAILYSIDNRSQEVMERILHVSI